ncbi:class I SAM-dependent methyltransferase [Flavobacterium nackdongense]|uniref:Class I SAM-dependent methyltransferase n=1 Tax=Flavobacterium nackdongense TaxID=2547394 RepID=A0A4P6YGA4_9FLAO|nr:class I SAM-dependent methyltransferase [Flavobacterium nackdongense]QBN19847.1 class I SAM-dependent methyltransferase [Flavobacterium nackdongense]
MNKFIKKLYRFFLKKPIEKIELRFNKMGKKRACYICNNRFHHFSKWRGGTRAVPLWLRKLEIIGGDFDNFGCPFCNSTDRERHLFMFFDKLNLWSKMGQSEILHFAPETNLRKKIEQYRPFSYVKADLYSNDLDIQKIDATAISFKEASFDIVICNHVLEHIPNYKNALIEFFRILKPGGLAILQTPYSKLLINNFEDGGINSNELRLIFHGQEDHVRVFGESTFFKSLKDVGFIVNRIKHSEFLNEIDSRYFGVSEDEDLIQVIKPQ